MRILTYTGPKKGWCCVSAGGLSQVSPLPYLSGWGCLGTLLKIQGERTGHGGLTYFLLIFIGLLAQELITKTNESPCYCWCKSTSGGARSYTGGLKWFQLVLICQHNWTETFWSTYAIIGCSILWGARKIPERKAFGCVCFSEIYNMWSITAHSKQVWQ